MDGERDPDDVRRAKPGLGADAEEQLRLLTARVWALETRMAELVELLPGGVVAAPPPPPLLPAVKGMAGVVPAAAEVFPARASAAVTGGAGRSKSLENRIGAEVFHRVGVFALLLAAAWFLKLAIGNGWIGPVGRVLVGLGAGTAVVLWSERFRARGYAAFSYSLKAVGTSVLYLSVWAAFQLYHLLPATVALLAMLLVTAWNGTMAFLQDAELLAGYAQAGAMLTPLLLATGGNHEVFLFVYVLAVDVATVVLARWKGWPRLLLGAFPATVAYFVGWYTRWYGAGALPVTSLFLVLFCAVFVVPSMGRERGARTRWSVVPEVLLPLGNAALLGLGMYSVLADAGQRGALPWVMVAASAVYLGLVRGRQAAVTRGVHLSLAVVFLTIAIPLKASGAWITLAWLVEGVALLGVALRATETEQARVLRGLAAGALGLGWAGAMVRVLLGYGEGMTPLLNGRSGTAVAALLAMAAAVWMVRRGGSGAEVAERWPRRQGVAMAAVVGFQVLAVTAGVAEISGWWRGGVADPELALWRALLTSAFLTVYGGALLLAGFWARSAFLRWQGIGLVVLTILKTFVWDLRNLSQGYRIASFLGLGLLLMGISFAYQKDWLLLRGPARGDEAGSEEPIA